MVENVPREYDIEVHQIKQGMENDLTSMATNVSCTELQASYAHTKELNKNSKKKDDHTFKAIMQCDDTAVGTFLVKQFKGSCDKCGKYGHRSVDCQDKQADGKIKGTDGKAADKGRQFNDKCQYCGKHGNRKEECCKRVMEMATSALDKQQDTRVRVDNKDYKRYNELG